MENSQIKFMLFYAFTTDNWLAGLKQFTNGDPTQEFPEAVTMIGRWHNLTSRSTIAIVESNSAENFYELSREMERYIGHDHNISHRSF